MNAKKFSMALGNVRDDYISEAISYSRPRRRIAWQKYAAIAACLCIAAVGAVAVIPRLRAQLDIEYGRGHDVVERVVYNGAEYIVCGIGEQSILEEHELPPVITAELAGAHLGYLTMTEGNVYRITETPGDGSIELLEYAPAARDDVYILRIGDRYFAAIRDAD